MPIDMSEIHPFKKAAPQAAHVREYAIVANTYHNYSENAPRARLAWHDFAQPLQKALTGARFAEKTAAAFSARRQRRSSERCSSLSLPVFQSKCTLRQRSPTTHTTHSTADSVSCAPYATSVTYTNDPASAATA